MLQGGSAYHPATAPCGPLPDKNSPTRPRWSDLLKAHQTNEEEKIRMHQTHWAISVCPKQFVLFSHSSQTGSSFFFFSSKLATVFFTSPKTTNIWLLERKWPICCICICGAGREFQSQVVGLDYCAATPVGKTTNTEFSNVYSNWLVHREHQLSS